VITVLFGLFGLIPAAMHAGRARRAGYPENRYWIAFGVSMVGSAALYLVVVFAALAFFVTTVGPTAADTGEVPVPFSSSAPAPSPAPPSVDGADGTCEYTRDGTGTVGTPPAEVMSSGSVDLRMTTNFGPIGLTLDQAAAPCAAASFVHLAQQSFFDGTPCHRETDSPGLRVLQCGDPTGTGRGGPGYSYPTRVTGAETYPRGTLSMANSGQGFDQSQFFLVWGDSQLPPSYTVVGTIDEAGLAVLDTIAANGIDGANAPNDGAPAQPVTIETMTVGG
jgi:peptidyl-prolyl cis-trans isomerase B (cyclophilin B)